MLSITKLPVGEIGLNEWRQTRTFDLDICLRRFERIRRFSEALIIVECFFDERAELGIAEGAPPLLGGEPNPSLAVLAP